MKSACIINVSEYFLLDLLLIHGPWERFQQTNNIRFEAISFERLTNQFNENGELVGDAIVDPDQYSLVVIDESQAYRNPATNALRLYVGSCVVVFQST